MLAAYAKVYLVAATLRPETMYGQTNCFLLPEGVYGAFEMADGTVFVCSERSMINMSYQEVRELIAGVPEAVCSVFSFETCVWMSGCLVVAQMTYANGKYKKLGEFTGQQLLGLPVGAPNSVYSVVYTLPLLTISMSKGTGVVTSVPSDAPDDYAALHDLQAKPKVSR